MSGPVDGSPPGARRSRTLAGVQEYLTLDQAAAELSTDSDVVYELVRRGAILGVYAPDAGGWRVARAELKRYRAGSASS